MGKTSGDTEVKYATFLEGAAQRLIGVDKDGNVTGEYGFKYTDLLIDDSPYADYELTDPCDGFFGVGYTLASFPSLYDMFGKFMAGLDIEALWNQDLNDSIYGTVVAEAVAASSAELDDQIKTQSLPRMEAGMRDMNAVMSSTFLINREIIEADKVRTIGKVQSELRSQALVLGQQRWIQHLQWNAQVISHYLSILHTYLDADSNYLTQKTQLDSANKLWPFTVLDHQRAIIGVLNGAAAAQVKRDSGFAKVLSGALGIASLLSMPIMGAGTLLGPAAAGAAAAGAPLTTSQLTIGR